MAKPTDTALLNGYRKVVVFAYNAIFFSLFLLAATSLTKKKKINKTRLMHKSSLDDTQTADYENM